MKHIKTKNFNLNYRFAKTHLLCFVSNKVGTTKYYEIHFIINNNETMDGVHFICLDKIR